MQTRIRHLGVGITFFFALTASARADIIVYDDSLENGFQNYAYGGGSDFANTTPVHAGSHSIAFVGSAFNAISFFHDPGSLASASYPVLKLWINGGSSGGQQFELVLQDAGAIVAQAALNDYLPSGGPAANVWQLVTIELAQPPLAFSGAFDRIDIQSNTAGTQTSAYFDDISLAAPAGGSDEIFANGFEAALGVPALLIEHDVAVDGMSSDRFRWSDRADQPRVAVLAHNDGQTGPGGTRGGELRQFQYATPAGTRSVNASGSFASGFGYVVSHRAEGTTGIPGDDSPLGHGFNGSFERVFEGRHHAILRFHQNYPRYSRTDATPPNTRYDVPVTIDWVFSSGRDNPLWAITWDLAGVPAEALNDDSRAPYGELLFDGSASEGAHSTIVGVAWGDRYKFTTTSNPVTFNSSWDWTEPNTIPYVSLWTSAVDATMGIVQTQTIAQHDAGGYWGVNRWGTTSAASAACNTVIGDGNYVMLCDSNWPYQSINYSLDPSQPNASTNNTRLAWGADYGFLGSAAYPIHGSAYYGGPLGNATAVGWPYQSYSTFIVLGLHSTDPVGDAVSQAEIMQSLVLSASVGSVVASGPAGIGRADAITYLPAGYDPVYAALRLDASGGTLSANIAVGSGQLVDPLLIIGNIGALPGSLHLNGVALVADVDYCASLRADTNELWITLKRNLGGATNAIELAP